MKKLILFTVLTMFIGPLFLFAQSPANDIPVNQLPNEAKQVLDKYVQVLNASSLDECANQFLDIAGGGLVNPAGTALRSSVKPYSLKKDHENIKFYKQPAVITRVNKTQSNGQGYGASAIKGTEYKIWIEKKDPSQGRPAPVSILIPEGHATIKTPKVVKIGSF